MEARRPTRFAACLLPLALLAAAAGCRSNDLVESELRARERDVRELRDELHRLEFQNEALQRELGASRSAGAHPVLPEVAASSFGLKRLTLGRGTGGLDDDRVPGDEALQVVLEPRDGDDAVIKAPGSASISALQISPEGLKTPISSWNVTPDELRRAWRSGLFTTGYVLVLPWQAPPTGEQVRVVVQFKTADGRVFEADRDVRVRPAPPSVPGPPAPAVPPAPVPVVPPAGEPLPPPRKLDLPPPPAQVQPLPGGQVTVERTATWEAPSLEGAVRLGRPESLRPAHPPGPSP